MKAKLVLKKKECECCKGIIIKLVTAHLKLVAPTKISQLTLTLCNERLIT